MKSKLTIFLSSLFFLIFTHIAASQELSAQQVFEKVNDAVVVIVSYDFEGKPLKQGTGVVISDDGFIVTNYHVFSKCEKLVILHNSRQITYSTIESADIEKDLLVLKINDNEFKKIEIGNSDEVKVGEQIFAIGSPLGYENTISEGIVSGLRNTNDESGNFIQITASISAGSSGGAVVNKRGQLIGISAFQNKSGQNLNFAIPINEVMELINNSGNDPVKKEAKSYFYKGYNAYLSENYKDAIFYYTAYLKIVDDASPAYFNRGLCYNSLENYEEALSDFNKAIQLYDENINAILARGHVYNILKKYNFAIDDFNKVITIDNTEPAAYEGRAESYYLMKDYKNSLADLEKAIYLDDSYVEAYYDRGNVYKVMGENYKAINDYTKAIELFPEYYNAHLKRGQAYGSLTEYEKAIQDLEYCIELRQDDKYSFNNLGWLYLDLKEYSKAVDNLKKSFELDNYDWDSILGMALAYYVNGKTDVAEKIFKEAVKIEPKLKKGMDGILQLEKEGFFYSQKQKKILKEFFDEIL